MATPLAAFSLSGRRIGGHAAIAVGLAVAALLLGGGGSPAPNTELALQILATIAAIGWLWVAGNHKIARPHQAAPWLLAGIVVLLPALQLVPLPPSLWQALPGRAVEVGALGLVDAAHTWRPWSLSPPSTLASLLSLGPPLLLLLMTASLPSEGRLLLIVAISAMALLSALVGAMQIAGGPAGPRLYAQGHLVGVTGFQANRNAAADVLLIGIVAIGAAVRHMPQVSARLGGIAPAIMIGLLALATILTGSRTGIALLPLALCLAWLAWRGAAASRRSIVAAIGAGVAILPMVLVALVGRLPALHWVANRFEAQDPRFDARFDIWSDVWFAAMQYWPFGAGMGTFGQIVLAAERIEQVDASAPNRAHNDYLELLLEAGLPGLMALALASALIAVLAWRAWRSRPADRAQIVFAIAVLAIIGLHSIIDYPLRSMALASLAGVAAGMLAVPGKIAAAERGERKWSGTAAAPPGPA